MALNPVPTAGLEGVPAFGHVFLMQHEVPLIQASPAFGADGLILITYDEGATGDRGRPHRVLEVSPEPPR